MLRVLGTATLIREIAKEMGWGVGGKGCKWDVCWTPTNHLLRSTKLRYITHYCGMEGGGRSTMRKGWVVVLELRAFMGM